MAIYLRNGGKIGNFCTACYVGVCPQKSVFAWYTLKAIFPGNKNLIRNCLSIFVRNITSLGEQREHGRLTHHCWLDEL